MKRIIISMLIIWLAAPAIADVPKLLNYQGRLTDASNQAVTDDDYTVQFRLYISETEVNSVWNETQTITTQDGYFHTLLGQVSSLTPSIFSQPLWLGIQIQGETEMAPRQQLASSPAALSVADGAIVREKISTDLWTKIMPIGTILSWHPNVTNPPLPLPDGFVECNGQTLTGTGGPLDGVVLPDLNGTKKFLRGSQSSGAEQGDAFQGHYHKVYYNHTSDSGDTYTVPFERSALSDSSSYSARLGCNAQNIISNGQNGTPRTANETRPVNMSVVWIMKIK